MAMTRRDYDDDFDDFFRKEYRRVVKFMMYVEAPVEIQDAEDAVSQAMAQAYARWPLLTHPASWVRKAAQRHYIKNAQADRKRDRTETEAAHLDGLDRVPAECREEPDERSRVIAALRCLPPAQREVMALTFDGYTPAEIAKLLHQQPDNVRSNLRHARDRLRREFGKPAAGGRAVGDEKEEV